MKTLLCFTVFGFIIFSVRAQVFSVDTAYTVDHLVEKILVGNGVRVGNIKLTGAKHGIGKFHCDTNIIGMKDGILLSTGNVYDAVGKNEKPNTTGNVKDPNVKKYKSDRDLNRVSKSTTYDGIILEFDFIPFNNRVSFRFCFASEEYTEYVGSRFNDVFVFMVTGDSLKKKNLALIPGINQPITINNINQNINPDLFINNDYFRFTGKGKKINEKPKVPLTKKIFGNLFVKKADLAGNSKMNKGLYKLLKENFEYDGFTNALIATCYLKPGKLYHLKIAIGDVGDAAYDSGVFLEEGSFNSEPDNSDPNYRRHQPVRETVALDSLFDKGKKKIAVIDTAELLSQHFEFTNVLFDLDKIDIPDSSKLQLNELAEYLTTRKELRCQLVGYTDSKGSKKYNQRLSERRAHAVMNHLKTKGIEVNRLTYIGNSDDNPVADNTTERGRALNRRVEIQLIEEE